MNSLRFKNKKLQLVQWLVHHLLSELQRLDLHLRNRL
jgi:hypothetical protein